MAVFSPRDHEGNLLDPGVDGLSRLASGRQFTLGQVMKAVVFIAVILAIAVQRPDLLVLPVLVFLFLTLAACLYGISRLPYRVRLTIELGTAFSLLLLSAWLWRPPWYVYQAERTEELARLCSTLADEADDDRSKDRFRREAAEYARRAGGLRLQALWYGLLRAATKEDPVAIGERELILELGLSESLEWHRQIAEQMGIPGVRRVP